MDPQSLYFQFFLNKTDNYAEEGKPDLYVEEHIVEIRQRIFKGLISILLLSLFCFITVKPIVEILKVPSYDVRFFQLAPGEYFGSTLKVAIFAGLFLSLPALLRQFVFFFCSGLSKQEKKYISSLLLLSVFLLCASFFFSYYILIPAALKFFLVYSSDIIEPFWSFEQYLSFVLVLFLTCGFVFQLPIVQIILSLAKVINPNKMLRVWKTVLLVATILSAILTPSADPVTQVLLTLAIVFLYLTGSLTSIYLTQIA